MDLSVETEVPDSVVMKASKPAVLSFAIMLSALGFLTISTDLNLIESSYLYHIGIKASSLYVSKLCISIGLVLISKPQELLLAITLADIGAERDKRSIDFI